MLISILALFTEVVASIFGFVASDLNRILGLFIQVYIVQFKGNQV